MKKSKKALLWTIVPVLGVSSGVAGAVAGVTNQKTSVDTNNVATSSTATTMATRSTSNTDGLKIDVQPVDKITFSGENVSFSTHVEGTSTSNIKYTWKVNKGKGKGWETHTSGSRGWTGVDAPITNELLSWSFKCEIKDLSTGWTATTNEVLLTIAPQAGRNIKVKTQPEPTKLVSSGGDVTLTTKAEGVGEYSGKKIGYQWFEYDSSTVSFTEISGADSNTYKFEAPRYTTNKTKKYVCKYYIDEGNGSKTYLSQSDQSVLTIKKETKEEFKVTYLTPNQEIKVGDEITLSAKATSTKTNNLKYKWYRSDAYGSPYKPIEGADSSEYKYKATKDDEGKKIFFCVLVAGIVQDDILNHFQSDNVEVEVKTSNGTLGSATNGTFANKLSVTSSVTTNQASVKSSTFYAIPGIQTPTYRVDVKGATGLTYEWYYVGRSGKEYSIDGATSNVLTTNRNLYELAYKENSYHKVGIMCKIYQDGKLVETVSQKTNSSFYMTVVTRR